MCDKMLNLIYINERQHSLHFIYYCNKFDKFV